MQWLCVNKFIYHITIQSVVFKTKSWPYSVINIICLTQQIGVDYWLLLHEYALSIYQVFMMRSIKKLACVFPLLSLTVHLLYTHVKRKKEIDICNELKAVMSNVPEFPEWAFPTCPLFPVDVWKEVQGSLSKIVSKIKRREVEQSVVAMDERNPQEYPHQLNNGVERETLYDIQEQLYFTDEYLWAMSTNDSAKTLTKPSTQPTQ